MVGPESSPQPAPRASAAASWARMSAISMSIHVLGRLAEDELSPGLATLRRPGAPSRLVDRVSSNLGQPRNRSRPTCLIEFVGHTTTSSPCSAAHESTYVRSSAVHVEPFHPIAAKHPINSRRDLTARDATRHCSGRHTVGRESGPYVGVKRCPSIVSNRSAVQSPDRDPSKPPATAVPSGTSTSTPSPHRPSVRYAPKPWTSLLPKNRSACGGSVRPVPRPPRQSCAVHPGRSSYTIRWIFDRSRLFA